VGTGSEVFLPLDIEELTSETPPYIYLRTIGKVGTASGIFSHAHYTDSSAQVCLCVYKVIYLYGGSKIKPTQRKTQF
jgi:uncharacterized membrane protein YagU involved in acid resistance